MLGSQVRVLSSILKLRHRIAAIAADCKSAVFRLRWFESNCLNKCSIRLTVSIQDFHSCNRVRFPDTVLNMVHIAQLAEHLIVVQMVVGSNPTMYPNLPLYLSWSENSICNPGVVGSNPTRGSKLWRGGGIGRRTTLRW